MRTTFKNTIKIASIILVAGAMICSCWKEAPERVLDGMTVSNNEVSVASVNTVSLEEAMSYAMTHHDGPEVKSDADVSIVPVTDSRNDTLMFIVNYSSGWKILSADKRIPAVLAYGEVGQMSLNGENPAWDTWLNAMKRDIAEVKQSEDCELTLSSEEIERNKRTWAKETLTRFNPDSPLYEIIVEHYSYTEPYQIVPHMVPAQWDQRYPFNEYITEFDLSGVRCPVGCGGVASGQMLRYFYKRNGAPSSFHGIPMDSLSVKYPNASTDSLFTTARYLKAIDDELGMHFSVLDLGIYHCSYVWPGQIEDFFSAMGYDSSFQSFDADVVKPILQSMNPVLMLAFDDIGSSEIIDYFSGHYFLIDGFQTRREVYVTHEYWVPIDGSPGICNERYTYSYGTPYFAMVKMNWGKTSQWSIGEDDGWYYLTSSWTVSGKDYDYLRRMLIFD